MSRNIQWRLRLAKLLCYATTRGQKLKKLPALSVRQAFVQLFVFNTRDVTSMLVFRWIRCQYRRGLISLCVPKINTARNRDVWAIDINAVAFIGLSATNHTQAVEFLSANSGGGYLPTQRGRKQFIEGILEATSLILGGKTQFFSNKQSRRIFAQSRG